MPKKRQSSNDTVALKPPGNARGLALDKISESTKQKSGAWESVTIDHLSESSSEKGSVSEESIDASSPKSIQNTNDAEVNNKLASPEVKDRESRLTSQTAFYSPNAI